MQINPKEVSVTTQSPALRYDDQEGCYLWMKGERHQISKDFVTTEFDCPCKNAGCQEQRISAAHIEKLQEVRNEVGAIRINSGYRCALHQEELRQQGYETAKGISTHQLGHASDIKAIDMAALLRACERRFKAIGVARSFLHVDERSDKVRRWGYVAFGFVAMYFL
jgi:hypothetical protein